MNTHLDQRTFKLTLEDEKIEDIKNELSSTNKPEHISKMNYSKMKRDQLIAICKENSIKGYSGKKKKELIEMIKQRDATPVSAPKFEAETDVKVKQPGIVMKAKPKKAKCSLPAISNELLLYLAQHTSQLLETKQDDLQKIKWKEGEANIETGFSKVACDCCQIAWSLIRESYPEFFDADIEASCPDISITLKRGGNKVARGKIELKSGEGVAIPGSTIGNLDINQPVIYCKRGGTTFEIFYSQYHKCMGQSDTDLFQDRTPRPFVSCERMAKPSEVVTYCEKENYEWIEHYAICADNRLSRGMNDSWQDTLVRKIKEPLEVRIAELEAHIAELKTRNAVEFVQRTSVEEFIRLKSCAAADSPPSAQ